MKYCWFVEDMGNLTWKQGLTKGSLIIIYEPVDKNITLELCNTVTKVLDDLVG